MVTSDILNKISTLKEIPNISSADTELLIQLENLLTSENYLDSLNGTVSNTLDNILNGLLNKRHIFNLMALLNDVSDVTKINYAPKLNRETKYINLSQLVKIISDSNAKENVRKRNATIAEIKENITSLLKFIFIGGIILIIAFITFNGIIPYGFHLVSSLVSSEPVRNLFETLDRFWNLFCNWFPNFILVLCGVLYVFFISFIFYGFLR